MENSDFNAPANATYTCKGCKLSISSSAVACSYKVGIGARKLSEICASKMYCPICGSKMEAVFHLAAYIDDNAIIREIA